MKIAIPMSINKTRFFINQAYVDYVSTIRGFEPVLITPRNNIAETLARCDGLLLPGGIDLDPIYYGEDNYSSYIVDPEKDAFERELFNVALRFKKPIFGICRGFQLIVNEYIDTHPATIGDLDFTPHINGHQQTDGLKLERGTPMHFVLTKPNLLYWRGGEFDLLSDTARMPVNSLHHQCLIIPEKTRLIGGLIPLALTKKGLSPKDDKDVVICEAFRIVDMDSPILAVQWHPEELKDYRLIEDFFKSANQNPTVDMVAGGKSGV